jgi:hypothetical protein
MRATSVDARADSRTALAHRIRGRFAAGMKGVLWKSSTVLRAALHHARCFARSNAAICRSFDHAQLKDFALHKFMPGRPQSVQFARREFAKARGFSAT